MTALFVLKFIEMTLDNSDTVAQLSALIELSALINSSLDIAEIRKRTMEAAMRLVYEEAGSLLFIDEKIGGLYFDTPLREQRGYI